MVTVGLAGPTLKTTEVMIGSVDVAPDEGVGPVGVVVGSVELTELSRVEATVNEAASDVGVEADASELDDVLSDELPPPHAASNSTAIATPGPSGVRIVGPLRQRSGSFERDGNTGQQLALGR
jgi:hypothetical protein